jgi:hypothetical protein
MAGRRRQSYGAGHINDAPLEGLGQRCQPGGVDQRARRIFPGCEQTADLHVVEGDNRQVRLAKGRPRSPGREGGIRPSAPGPSQLRGDNGVQDQPHGHSLGRSTAWPIGVYVLTDRGVPMGRIVPFRPSRRWVAARDARMLLSEPVGSTWSADLRQARDAEALRDPWAAGAGGRERAQG